MNPELRVAVFSDTHGNTAKMLKAVRLIRPDVLIHLGDYERDTAVLTRDFPELPLYSVAGNCDMSPASPLSQTLSLGPVKALICHGHSYSVDWDLGRLYYAAQEQGCQIAMYGHTHRADCQEIGGVKLLNPGTAGKGVRLSFALVEVYPNGGLSCEIRPL